MFGSVGRQSLGLYFGIVKPSNAAIPVKRVGGGLVLVPCVVWSGTRDQYTMKDWSVWWLRTHQESLRRLWGDQ